MGSASRYWRLIRIDAAGQRKVEENAIAKAFFQQQFADFLSQPDVPDAPIQRELLRLWQEEPVPVTQSAASLHLVPEILTRQTSIQETLATRDRAEWCLRCFISHEIEQTCVRLEATFGANHGFTRYDLFPLVLNDEGQARSRRQSPSQSLAREILQTFEPARAGLSTWVARQVRQHRELHRFLLQHGVYLASDWAILNDTSPDQLQRILAEFYALTPTETEQACALLQSYHDVYRHDRLQSRAAGTLKGKAGCLPPTSQQLTRIAQSLYERTTLHQSPERIMSRLQTIATQLRHYRIQIRGGTIPTESIDTLKQEMEAPEEEIDQGEQIEFIAFYREQFLHCLDWAIERVTSDRLAYLERKDQQKVQQFLKALQLFHCQGRSMGEIATELNLQAQYQVTRLIKLKDFRADIRQRLLHRLGESILNKASHYANPDRLRDLDHQVQAVLEDTISHLIKEAETEAAIAKHHPLPSLFSRRLCHHLDTRIGAP